MGQRELFIDIETFSGVDLPAAGLYPYVESEDFEILLIAYAFGDEPVRLLDLADRPDELTGDRALMLEANIREPGLLKIAHNNAFERTALGKWCGAYLPPEEWSDTMILAAMNGLPMSLDAAGAALGIELQKMKEGTGLISYFCKPCKPTASNGWRTRNLPEHAPDKWATFRSYCIRDVEAMRQIYRRLQHTSIPDWERRVWYMDAHINERGVLIDRTLAEAAVAVDCAFRETNMEEMRRLTGLENPNSISQLRAWLESVGITVDSLGKATVAELRGAATDPTTKRVLELRQLLGKTSTKKYETMLNAACRDDRVRGITQYYGASRTGRWAGRQVQLQNLPQNHLDDIETVRELVRARDLSGLELLYDSVPDVLSQLIRTAFIAKPGHTFLVADYSAIEARVIAYLAGEKWRMEVFAAGGDIYCSSASQMFKVPVEKHGINSHLRQKGKVAELACIAEGQQVLTDQGLVAIEKVTSEMKLWDGTEWVSHSGVVCRGEKEVITYGGLEATPDHIVWAEVNGKSRTVRFGIAASRGTHLLKTGDGGRALRMGANHQSGKAVEQTLEPLLCSDTVQRLRSNPMAGSWESEDWEIQGVSELLTTESRSPLAEQPIHRSQAAVHEPEKQELPKLRSERNRISIRERDRSLPLYDRELRTSKPGDGTGQNQRERSLRTRQSSLGNASAELPKSTQIPRKVRTYDILNAGPNHRFTVSGVLVHNCGYGGGVAALRAFGADKMGLSEEEMQSIVAQWRLASPTIPKLWRDTENAAKRALTTPGRTFTIPCGVKYKRDADGLRCRLPSGRILTYWGARLEEGSIHYMGQNQTTRKWEPAETWGGRLVENIVQGFARDCLAEAMLRLTDAGYSIVFHVHDEVIAEAPEGSRWEDMAEIMGQPLDWAPGLLLRADGYSTKFYKKD